MNRKIDPKDYKLIFSCLEKARKSSGLTLSEIATKVPTNEAYIQAIERGEKMLSLNKLVGLTNAYGAKLGQFLEDYISADTVLPEKEAIEIFQGYSFKELVTMLDITEDILSRLKVNNETEAE